MITRAEFLKSPHVGIFCLANDSLCLAPINCTKELEDAITEHLKVDVVKTSMARTGLLGIFASMNNKLLITSDILEKDELQTLKDYLPEVLVLNAKHTAVGNVVAMNDHGIACTKALQKYIADSVSIKLADTDLIGSAVYVNNVGFLASQESTEWDVADLKRVFKVEGDIGTVNFGDMFVRSGLVGNKNGIIAGMSTSGPELNRIEDIFILGK